MDFFSFDTDRNIYQVAHQITMDPAHKDDVSYKNRYDVTVLMNGLPLIQVELKRPGVEINEASPDVNVVITRMLFSGASFLSEENKFRRMFTIVFSVVVKIIEHNTLYTIF